MTRRQESRIRSAAEEEWPFEDWREQGEGEIAPPPRTTCAVGSSEEVFAERLSVAIWKANGAYCEVVVKATYLESLPYETHSLDEDDYARLITGKNAEEKG